MLRIFWKIKKSSKFWWLLTGFWTLLVYAVIIFDYVKDNAWQGYLNPLLVVYVGILAIYAGDKEFERWHHSHKTRHPGELYVILWTILLGAIFLLNCFLKKPYNLPGEVISTYIGVLSILAITRRSRAVYERRHRRR